MSEDVSDDPCQVAEASEAGGKVNRPKPPSYTARDVASEVPGADMI